MNPPRGPGLAFPALVILLSVTPCAATQEPPPAADVASGTAPRWEIEGTASQYFLPDDVDYLQPIVAADREALHLEARYNYEDLDTGSFFAGWNYEHGGRLQFAITPMAGLVLGPTEGIAPGFEMTLGYKRLELYTEFEYVFDRKDSDASFMYNWSELSYAPVDWFRFGMTTQRTRVYRTERDIQRALLLGCTIGKISLTAHLFNPGADDAFYVLAMAATF